MPSFQSISDPKSEENIIVIPSTSPSPSTQSSKNRFYNTLLFIIFLLILLVPVGVYVFFKTTHNSFSTSNNQISKVAITPTNSPKEQISFPAIADDSGLLPPSPTVQPTTVPLDTTDWTSGKSQYCNTSFSLPPVENPYIEYRDVGKNPSDDYKRIWQVRDGLYIDRSAEGNTLFRAYTTILYTATKEDNGFIPALLSIECGPNTKNYTLDTLAQRYIEGFSDQVRSIISIRSQRRDTKWGKDVVIANFNGELFADRDYYFVLSNNYYYKIYKRADLKKDIVQRTTNYIFDSLKFTP